MINVKKVAPKLQAEALIYFNRDTKAQNQNNRD